MMHGSVSKVRRTDVMHYVLAFWRAACLFSAQFHDFTNPCQDDDADAFFETCDHESLPTGESSKQFVTVQEQSGEVVASSSDCRTSLAHNPSVETGDVSMGSDEVAVMSEGHQEDQENVAVQTRKSGASCSKKSLGTGANKPASSLTESIMALAGFKGKEAELTKIAQSTIATAAAAVSSPIAGLDGPIASRTRRSLEGAKKSFGSARKGGPATAKARKSEEKKRVHKAGASTTPSKSVSKKPRTEEKRSVHTTGAKTPTFERFGGARGRSGGVSSTPNGRSSSAPAPRSGRKAVNSVRAPFLFAEFGMQDAISFQTCLTSLSMPSRLTRRRRPPCSCAQRRAQKRAPMVAAQVPLPCVRRLLLLLHV